MPAALIMALATAAPIACQTGTATVTVVERSRLNVIVSPSSYTGEPGDTLTFVAVAVDTVSGDTIPAVIRWTSDDPVGVMIEPNTGLATLMRAGTYTVTATVTELVSMLIMRQEDDGSWREVFVRERQATYAETGIVPPNIVLSEPTCADWDFSDAVPDGLGGWTVAPTCNQRNDDGETAFLCAYGESEEGLYYTLPDVNWSSSDESVATVTSGTGGVNPLCPTWTPGMPFPVGQARGPIPNPGWFLQRGVRAG
jgi:plastocyanin